MTEQFPVPEIPQDPDDMSDTWCIDRMKEVRNYRSTRNLSFPRFVRALHRAGFPDITVEEYKLCETRPASSGPFVREGLLTYCYKVLNTTRVEGSAQDPITEHVVMRLTAERQARDYSHADMANRLTYAGAPISAASWRTIEQGITTNVPLHVAVIAARILEIPLEELIP
jgi:hypothetical protein